MHCCSTCLSSRLRTAATASPAITDINTLCCFWTRDGEKHFTHFWHESLWVPDSEEIRSSSSPIRRHHFLQSHSLFSITQAMFLTHTPHSSTHWTIPCWNRCRVKSNSSSLGFSLLRTWFRRSRMRLRREICR